MASYDLFSKEKTKGEDTGYFAILIQNMKTHEVHEMMRYAVELPCTITGKPNVENNSFIIHLEHNAIADNKE